MFEHNYLLFPSLSVVLSLRDVPKTVFFSKPKWEGTLPGSPLPPPVATALLQPKLRQDLVVLMSVPAHRFRGKDQKKWSSLRYLRLCHRRLLAERKFAYVWAALAVFWGHRPRNPFQWHRAGYFILGQNPRLGGTVFAGGVTSSNLVRHCPEMPPSGARPTLFIFENPMVMQLFRRVLQKISHSEKLQLKCVVDFYIVDCFSVCWLLARLILT